MQLNVTEKQQAFTGNYQYKVAYKDPILDAVYNTETGAGHNPVGLSGPGINPFGVNYTAEAWSGGYYGKQEGSLGPFGGNITVDMQLNPIGHGFSVLQGITTSVLIGLVVFALVLLVLAYVFNLLDLGGIARRLGSTGSSVMERVRTTKAQRQQTS